MSLKVAVLGCNGMLGKYATSYLGSFYQIIGLSRNHFDFNNKSRDEIFTFLDSLQLSSNDVVVNCVGVIKPSVKILGESQTIFVNAYLPHILADWCEKHMVHLIHPSTDCVFDGATGSYNENATHNDLDIYGRTKSLGEPPNCTIIRVSIIGEEVGQGRSLVEWVKTNANKEVTGYQNHYWNGITCLEWCKLVHQIIQDNAWWTGVRHVFSEDITKANLVQLISDTYNLNIKVNYIDGSVSCNRTLRTVYDNPIHTSLPVQIAEMYEFQKNLTLV